MKFKKSRSTIEHTDKFGDRLEVDLQFTNREDSTLYFSSQRADGVGVAVKVSRKAALKLADLIKEHVG
jgi:hypothetical protein